MNSFCPPGLRLFKHALSACCVLIAAQFAPLSHAQKLPDINPPAAGAKTLPPSSSTAKTFGGSATTITQCGPANGGMFPSPPASGLCAAGSVVTVPIVALGATQYQWTCGSPPPVTGVLGMPLLLAPSVCTANKKYNGQCGTASGTTTPSAPTANLCALGTASTPVQAGANYTWSCTGVLPATGATVANCSAPFVAYTIGVAVTGLPSGNTVVLQNNGGNNLTVTANGAATFSSPVAAVYAVTVGTQPVDANCLVTGGNGTATSNVAGISVACTPNRFSLVANTSSGFYNVTDCVKDNVTGLIWEGKTATGARAGGNGYTHYDDTTKNQVLIPSTGGGVGMSFPPSGAQINAASNSIGYKNYVNGLNLCGSSLWRMPTLAELNDLATAAGGASISNTWFPNNGAFVVWSSTSPSSSFMGFVTGGAPFVRNNGQYMRLVR
jgi:hypothetical protein